MICIIHPILRRLAKIHSESDLIKATPHIKLHFQFSSVQNGVIYIIHLNLRRLATPHIKLHFQVSSVQNGVIYCAHVLHQFEQYF